MFSEGPMEPINHRGPNCSIDEFAPVDSPRLVLSALEMTINGLVLVSSLLFCSILARMSTFTRTLKCLFFSLLFASFNIAWTRLFLLQPQYIAGDRPLFAPSFLNPFQIFHDLCINVNTILQLAITLECLLSTLCPQLHSRLSTSIPLGLLNGLWPWLVTLFLYVLDQKRILPTVQEFIFLEFLNLSSWTIFLRLYFINRQKYKRIEAGNLDRKYQITVKIRTLRTLLFLSALTSLRNFLTMALLLAIILFLNPKCLHSVVLLCGHAYDLTVAIYSLLLCVPIIATHGECRKHFKRLLFGARRTSAVNVTRTSGTWVGARNALGEELILAHNNPDEHFQQLARSWGEMPLEKRTKTTTKKGMAKLRAIRQFELMAKGGTGEMTRRRTPLELEIQ